MLFSVSEPIIAFCMSEATSATVAAFIVFSKILRYFLRFFPKRRRYEAKSAFSEYAFFRWHFLRHAIAVSSPMISQPGKYGIFGFRRNKT
jgi:hypothetical protein